MDKILIIICVLMSSLSAIFSLIEMVKSKGGNGGNNDLLAQKIDINAKITDNRLDKLTSAMNNLTDKNYQQQLRIVQAFNDNTDRQSQKIKESVKSLQDSNEKKLEQMRVTVDEKLMSTLNTRLNASFKTVSEQLSNVYKSLGEMRQLSAGVTENVKGLNRVLTNVKSRGTWAEVQLGNILDQTIPGMYDTNVRTNPRYNGQVEFAVRIPSVDSDDITYLPIDSKFPMEDYARLSAAAEAGDLAALSVAKKALELRVKEEAKAIKQYISEPQTTPFAIMYLATEGLYAEITSSTTGIAERLQQDGIMIAGPSTVTALLNSMSMGFRTMAINQKANEVWKILGAAKGQYEKFGSLLEKARRKVDEAGKALDEADHRNSIIQRKLRDVESLDLPQNDDVLGIED